MFRGLRVPLIGVCLAAISSLACAAPSPAVVGASCPVLGTTQISSDHGSIVACLLNNANGDSDCTNGCSWKSTSGGGARLVGVAQPVTAFSYSGNCTGWGFSILPWSTTTMGPIASNSFTAPANGYYSFETKIAFQNCTDALISGVYVNGARISDGSNTGASPAGQTCWSSINNTVYMAVGDKADVRYCHTGNTTGTLYVHQPLFVTAY